MTTNATAGRGLCGRPGTPTIPHLEQNMTTDPTADRAAFRDRIAEALRQAAFECDGKCGLSERECYDAHPINWSAMVNGTTHVDAPVTAIADVVLAELRRLAVEAHDTGTQQQEARCTRCTHPKGDHDGRSDHRAKFSPLVAGEPWCHACNAACDYAPAEQQPAAADGEETPVVAYRSLGGLILRCLNHIPPEPEGDFIPVTSDDLPDGGICTHPECGVDVLAQPPRP